MNRNSNNKRIAKNTIFLYGRQIFTLLITLYTTRVILSTLGVVDYGVYNVVCGFVSLFAFLNTSMSNGIQRYYNYEAGRHGITAITKVFQTSIIIQIFLILILLMVLEPFGIWYINNKMVIPVERLYAANWIFQLSLLSLFFLVLQVPFSASIMAYERMDYFATVSILDSFLKLVVILMLPFFEGDRLIIYGCLVLAISILNFLFYSVYAIKNFKELVFSVTLHKPLMISIIKFTGWNLIEMFAWTTQGQGVNMILNLFFGPIVNAAQGIASQINAALSSFCSNLSVAFRPQLIQSYAEKNYQRTIQMSYVMTKAMFGMMCVMIFPIIIELPTILQLWLGNNIPDYTISFTSLILLSMLPRNLTMPLSQIVHATGRMKDYQLGSALVILLILPISYIALRSGIEPYYIYIVNIFVYILLWGVDLYLLNKVFIFPIKSYLFDVIKPCLITLIIVPIFPLLVNNSFDATIARLVANLFVSILTTIFIIYYILLNKNERNFVLSLIKIRNK